MEKMTAKDLKNRTGEAIRIVSAGKKVVITLRGKPFAVIAPIQDVILEESNLRPMDVAWKDIENTIKKSTPKFKTSGEAMNWTRKRAS